MAILEESSVTQNLRFIFKYNVYSSLALFSLIFHTRFVGAVSDLVLPWAGASPEGRSLCNHRRAYKFFTDSVSPKCHFPAFPCANYDTFLEVSILNFLCNF